jgi:hypothetical protein
MAQINFAASQWQLALRRGRQKLSVRERVEQLEEALSELLPRGRRGGACPLQQAMAQLVRVLHQQQRDNGRGSKLAEQARLEISKGDPPARQSHRRRRLHYFSGGGVAFPQANLARYLIVESDRNKLS